MADIAAKTVNFGDELDRLVQSEVGSRMLGPKMYGFVCYTALLWSILQLWVASPLQYVIASWLECSWIIVDDAQMRQFHLAFAFALAFALFPRSRDIQHTKEMPIFDWLLMLAGICATLYLTVFYEEVFARLGDATIADTVISWMGVVILLEAARRTVSISVAIITLIFLLFSYFGPYLGDLLSHKGHSLSSIASHQWISYEGVFGLSLGVSSSFIFLYVLFGSMLEKAGAGNFFIQLSFVLLRRFTGGPAKAAVVASGLMGMISGSSMANTITVGSLTIPLMKKMGLSPSKAAAIEVSAGMNGQIMPPVMGASAFIMADYLSIPYTEVIKHAFLPAVLVYIALLYIVHLESLRIGFNPASQDVRTARPQWIYSMLRGALVTTLTFLGFGCFYFLIEGASFLNFSGVKALLGSYYSISISAATFLIYVLTLAFQPPENEMEKDADLGIPRDAWKLLISGLHYFIPLIILVWCLLVEHYSPALAAYWTIGFLIVMLLTQQPLHHYFHYGTVGIKKSFRSGFDNLFDSFVAGGKNMTVVAIATATAGMIVGSISLTGLGLKISGLVDYISSGNVFIALILTALICIILGMGMPTTACYIIVSTIMVPVLDALLSKSGISTPKLAIHLFVFYFGLMADITPPVGLASFAAAAIAKANPITTGIQAFMYNMRTMTLPFIFIFNPSILLYNITSIEDLAMTVVNSLLGVMGIAAATQGYCIIKSKWYESGILLVAGLSLLFPKAWPEIIFHTAISVPVDAVESTIVDEKHSVKLFFKDSKTQDRDAKSIDRLLVLPSEQSPSSIAELMHSAGINYTISKDGWLRVVTIHYGSYANKRGVELNSNIVRIELSKNENYVALIVIAAYLLLALVFFAQRRRCRTK